MQDHLGGEEPAANARRRGESLTLSQDKVPNKCHALNNNRQQNTDKHQERLIRGCMN